MKRERVDGKKKPAAFEISLAAEDWNLLMLALGLAVGSTMIRGEKKLAYSLVCLANRVNKNNPNWTPYAIPSDAEFEADSKIDE